MAFSGGTFSRLYSWASDQSNGIKIRADRMDGEMDGMATGLSTCLLKDGTQTATARIPFAAGIKMGGQSIQLDPANSSAITAGTNNIIIVSANGADQVKFTDGTIEPATDNDIDLGTSSKEFKDAYFDGTVTTDALTLGTSTSVTSVDADLSSVSSSDDTLASAKAIKTYVDGQVTAQDLDFAGGSGTGSVDLDSQSFTIAGTSNEIETSASGQTLTVGLPTNVTIGGELDVTTLDVSGDADIDGTTNLDAVDIDGNVQLDGTLTVGVDDTGYDVKLFGATSGAYVEWDASADKLLTAGGAVVDINGGAIDGTTIGGATPAAGSFTTLTASGVASFASGSAGAPGIAFSADTDNGAAYVNTDNWGVVAGGSYNLYFQGSQTFTNKALYGLNAAGPAFLDEAASATNPTLNPNRADLDTCVGWASADVGALVAGGISAFRWNAISSAVNYVRVLAHTSGNNPVIYFEGSDTNVPGYITTKGSGNLRFGYNSGGNDALTINGSTGAVSITGALSKGSGSFRIDHPLDALSDTHDLVHSFVEGPQADLIYRGRATLSSGSATVDIDGAAGMTDGTFEALCRDVQCFTSNETGWTAVRGSVTGATLTIEAQDADCADTISWMVVAERKDQHMIETAWTDAEGRPIIEPLKEDEDE